MHHPGGVSARTTRIFAERATLKLAHCSQKKRKMRERGKTVYIYTYTRIYRACEKSGWARRENYTSMHMLILAREQNKVSERARGERYEERRRRRRRSSRKFPSLDVGDARTIVVQLPPPQNVS